VKSGAVTVVGVAHQKRRPGYWSSRWRGPTPSCSRLLTLSALW